MVNMRQGLQRVKVGVAALEWNSCGDLSRTSDIRRDLYLSATISLRRPKSYESKINDSESIKFYDEVLPLSN
jgi:hypothetical protein